MGHFRTIVGLLSCKNCAPWCGADTIAAIHTINNSFNLACCDFDALDARVVSHFGPAILIANDNMSIVDGVRVDYDTQAMDWNQFVNANTESVSKINETNVLVRVG